MIGFGGNYEFDTNLTPVILQQCLKPPRDPKQLEQCRTLGEHGFLDSRREKRQLSANVNPWFHMTQSLQPPPGGKKCLNRSTSWTQMKFVRGVLGMGYL